MRSIIVSCMVLGVGACVEAGERAEHDTRVTTSSDTGTTTSATDTSTTTDTGSGASDAPTSTGASDTTTGTTPSDVVEPEVTPPDPLPTVQVDRAFVCDPQAIGDLSDIAPVAGVEGATLAIRSRASRSSAPCTFDLVYRSTGAEPVVIQRADGGGGGWLLAVAGRAASGRIVVCASDIAHAPDPGSDTTDPSAPPRRIERVDVLCATGDGSTFTPLSPVVETDATYAAWALGLEQSDETPGRYRLVWIRDFSFQFANVNNRGRPDTDGIHTTTFDVGAGGAITIGPTARVSDVIAPADLVQREWVPTPEERERHADYIDFDEGTCAAPDGCELP